MNKFKVGDKVYCIVKNSPKIKKEFIVTCVSDNFIGFVSNYPKGKNYKEVREGKIAWWDFESFRFLSSAEDRKNPFFYEHTSRMMLQLDGLYQESYNTPKKKPPKIIRNVMEDIIMKEIKNALKAKRK